MRKINSESNVYSTCTYCLLTNDASQLLVKLCIAVHGLITPSYYRKKKDKSSQRGLWPSHTSIAIYNELEVGESNCFSNL